MSNFRTKLLGLAAFATLFAGASYGQGITGCGSLGVTPGPTNERAEGTTELAGDANFSCANATSSTTATVTVFATAPITSQLLANDTALTGPLTEAVLFICNSAATTAPTTQCTSAAAANTASPYYGTVSGTQITFTGVTIPAFGFSGLIENVRMNASAVTIGSTLTTVTETILASANNTSAATTAITTGFVFASLAAPAFIPTPNGALTATVTSYTACAGNALPFTGTLTKLSFGVAVAETFGGAFKTGTGLGAANGEGGSYLGAAATKAGTATSGTKVQITINNVATGMTVYAPTSITNAVTGANTLSLTMVSSATAADPIVAVAASTATGAPAAVLAAASPFTATWPTESWGASAAFTPTNGTVTIVYEVSASNPSFIESAVVPVFVTFGGNVFTTAPAQLTVLESYAPTAAAAAATTIPNFAPPTNTALPATTVSLCQTSLMFPFITNQLGFDTGIVIANTTTDLFHTTPVPGTCTLNFYGAGAPTPSTGVAAPGGTQASGTTNAFLLSSVAPGFQGYMIAQCNYTDAYGYAFIEYNLTQNSGVVEGYIAPSLNRPGGVATLGN